MGSRQTFFISTMAVQRRPIFLWDPNPGTLLDVLLHYRERGNYLLHEFAILPDQLQAIITPMDDATAETAVTLIRNEFSFRIAQRAKTSIWEKDFTVEPILTIAHYENFRRAIHLGPVRAGLAAQPTLYAFSSARPDFQVDSSPQP